MSGIVDNPFVVFAAFLVAQWGSQPISAILCLAPAAGKEDELADLDIVRYRHPDAPPR